MADAVIAANSEFTDVWGKHRVYGCELTDVADAETLTVKGGISRILNVQTTFKDADAVAADFVHVASVSGGTITFQAEGTDTNQTIYLLVIGI